MAPIRRYLRITKHSVLEVRIYLDRPSDAEGWLLRRDNPALPRVIQAVRPLVLPKLREENERAKGRGSKTRKTGVKDVVVEDDFEVSIFLTELSTRHSVLTKQKIFKDRRRIQSNSGKLTSWLTTGTGDRPDVISEHSTEPIILREDDEDEPINLDDIPGVSSNGEQDKNSISHIRRRGDSLGTTNSERSDNGRETQDDKKLSLNTSYDGFSIYGRILCLVVKRKGSRNTAGGTTATTSSQRMLENWVSTQAAAENVDDDDNNG
ncbi:hypothetical protein CC78DRAFT_506226 [Lojkania enalia]|uniref:Uncharacterized protein n=1 Tax=Lojkania enalia TaxID=147567 RepID=A0A9P4NCX4_9PLEO|nr:hypothetical protein CC78DRAFT_506226 [Didymosphaeria enalia]